ncbi:flavoprotein [Thiohalobacter sp. COW1]|uniref:NADPH-dependent FMN reductase n=1 Tax=Thiohalobacter thiocyanaticus TaxID=585455 RepID=A0A1Z4VN66_9GAMM|nr:MULTISPECIES: NAD(P)H-dependent oxidoreductase [Thiohalobacter]BAZ92664.1 NADPH-dependent FMN reductase [Thiohalobacter thiocyanaticus]BCO32378.1 flavoprotein [Thiohalobacter sp. COW1]
MKLTIISGSHREEAQSLKVAGYVERTLQEKQLCEETALISLSGNPLPLWDQGIWDKDPAWEAHLNPIRAELSASDGFVVVSPEWHGQVPAGLKNFFLMCSRFEVGHKPALIVTVSSADGGAYPVAELRMSSYKNNRICYIPEQVIVRNVESVLNDNPDDNNPDADQYFRERFEWSLGILREYALALRQVRASGATDTDKFKNGM